MKNSITTFEQVSKEVKTKISKIGTLSLLKKFKSGAFEGEELIAAKHYLIKRGELKEEEPQQYEEHTEEEASQLMKTGKHVSKMTEEEKKDAVDKLEKKKSKNKAEVKEEKKEAKSKKGEKVDQVKKDKKVEDPTIKLTTQEFQLFEDIKRRNLENSKAKTFDQAVLHEDGKFESLREFKGVLSSLRKKDIVHYEGDSAVELTALGKDMIKGKMSYKEKSKNERNFFKKERLTKDVDGKEMDKSSYVRALLRKNKNITYSELKDKLTQVGFPKLYHSELQRCREQLGIQSTKTED